MLTPRIFVGADGLSPAAGVDYTLGRAAAHHVAQVLRMRVGDPLALFTGTGGEHAATIAAIDRRSVVVHVGPHDDVERENPWPVTLAQAVIAADMMDLVVRRAVELGVAAIAPIRSARSQNVPAERTARRADHWRQVAIGACEQCGRNRVPEILPAVPFADWLDASSEARHPIAMLDAVAPRSLAEVAASAAPRTIAVGPEGGFTSEELRAAAARGAARVHLGARMLRAETAALAALATINAIAGDAR